MAKMQPQCSRETIIAAVRNTGLPRPRHALHLLHRDQPRHRASHFDSDGPGERARLGPRHDNDHVYIQNIRILPTADESLSLRSPWLPSKNVDSIHFMPHGYARNVDVHFRLLRYDTTESIRDINYHAAQQAFLARPLSQDLFTKDFLETTIGNRYFLYPNIHIEDIVPNEEEGVMLRVSFDCPSALQGTKIYKSTRLEPGMLSAILLLDQATDELSIHYFNIQMRQSTHSLATRRACHERAAVELSFLPDIEANECLDIMRLVVGAKRRFRMALVEYPKLLYAGFAHVLKCLQNMSDFDYAFGQYVSPRQITYTNANSELAIKPPSYSVQPGFMFDLQPLTGHPDSHFSLEHLRGDQLIDTLQHLQTHTTLDSGQAMALLSSLSQELSFCQGPPGCGKTFLSIALTRVLLASRSAHSKKPVLVVCRTNHALDSFMAGLRDAGVEKLMRIGSGSKAEWTNSINLRSIGRESKYSSREHGQRSRITEEKGSNWESLDAWCRDLSRESLTGIPCWQHVYPIIRDFNPRLYAQLVTCTNKPSAYAFTYDYWARGGDLAAIQSLHRQLLARINASNGEGGKPSISEASARSLLANIAADAEIRSSAAGEDDIWRLTLKERTDLIGDWQARIDRQETAAELLRIHEKHKLLLRLGKSIRDDKDSRVMLEQDVVGMTTTACAARRGILRAVGFEIMICEEAGEVLEAHSLCTLLPTLKHAIHVGDPLQLRPSIEEQTLAMENTRGRMYRLNESLFERIMKPVDPRAKTIPTTKLRVQRRMHPEIARISRITYPFLEDHKCTYTHQLPKGLHHRSWWLDHKIREDAPDSVSRSITNDHEVKIIKELVSYMLRGNDYNYGDIAILTPYSSQLLKLRQSLSEDFTIWLSEKDKDALVEVSAIDPDSDQLDVQKELNIPMGSFIRLATIDNFQGEEAKVIILSLVRSGNKLGFVKSKNRINVACSRARDGFYVVGDSSSLEADPMWRSIIEVFRSEERIAEYIRLECERHPENFKLVSCGEDIVSFGNSTCMVLCGQKLSCGHLCDKKCHEATLHNIMSCQQRCRKKLDCGHRCQNECGEVCSPCPKNTLRHLPDCGHTILVPCSAEAAACDRFEGYRDLNCGRHAVPFFCGDVNQGSICEILCDETLPCGHHCNAKCGTCYAEGKHPKCNQVCNKKMDCDHLCINVCHAKKRCAPCQQSARASCSHHDSDRVCHERVTSCVASVPALGPDGVSHETICCFTNVETVSHNEVYLLTASEIRPLIQPVISKLIARHTTLEQQIKHQGDLLCRTAPLFLHQQVNPIPIAATKNIESILRRSDDFIALQHQITAEKGTLSILDHTLQLLERHYPGQGPTSLNGLMLQKLNDLEIWAALIRARDTLSTVSFLMISEDQSLQMQRSGRELALFMKTELAALVDEFDGDMLVMDQIDECRRVIEDINVLLRV